MGKIRLLERYINTVSDNECMKQGLVRVAKSILLIVLILITGCVQQQVVQKQTSVQPDQAEQMSIVAQLTNAEGGEFVPAAGYYEGRLVLSDKETGREYFIFACSKSWDWVQKGSCYTFNPAEIRQNENQHQYSMELSGCYVGKLEQVSC